MTMFMSYKTEETFIKQNQGKAAKNATFDFSGNCDSFLVLRVNSKNKEL